MRRFKGAAVAAAVLVGASGCAFVGRVGVSSSAQQPGGGFISGSDITTNGRYIVFTSDAANLVPNDTNNAPDVFLRDNQTGVTERVSISDSEAQGNIGGYGGLVSDDGRYVAFNSDATNLLTVTDTNDSTDVFLRDRELGTTRRVSIRNGGGQSDSSSYLTSMSPDGNWVVFDSEAENLVLLDENFSTDVYLRDRAGATTQRISVSTDEEEGDLDSFGGSISNDGRYVAFLSNASNFSIDDSGIYTDVYVRDRTLTTTDRVTELDDATEADFDSTRAVISGNGQVVAFETDAANLIDPEDANNTTDVYASVRGSHAFEKLSTAPGGGDADDFSFITGISDDGRFVLYQSGASNLRATPTVAESNSFVHDRTVHSNTLAGLTQSQGEPSNPDPLLGGSTPAAISGDGRYVLYSSTAQDVVPNDTNETVPDLFMQSNPVPFILFATPNTVARGASTTIQLNGTNFRAAGALALMGEGITVNSVTQVSENRVDVNVTVAAGAPVGPRTPFLIQSGSGGGSFSGGIVFLPNAFSVV